MSNFDMEKRKRFANSIVEISKEYEKYIATDNRSLVMSINASWGMGKTTFLDGLKALMQNDENAKLFNVFRFNVWEHDIFDNPLCPFMYSIYDEYKEADIRSNLIKNTRDIGLYIGKTWFTNAMREKLKFPVDELMEKIKEIDLGEIDPEKIKNCIEESKSNYLDEYISFKKAKDSLEKFLKDEIDKNKIKVFIIDELDRCRPDYAIELLETIKHFLNIPQYVFIFAVDFEQLSESVKQLYGRNIDADGYLRRFFDINFNLPNPEIDIFCSSNKHIVYQQLLSRAFISDLVEKLSLSLRDLTTIFKNFDILYNAGLKKGGYGDKIKFFFFMTALKYKKPKDYKAILSETVMKEDVTSRNNGTNIPNYTIPSNYYKITGIERYLSCFHLDNNTKSLIQLMSSEIENIVNAFGPIEGYGTLGNYVESKMELLEWMD